MDVKMGASAKGQATAGCPQPYGHAALPPVVAFPYVGRRLLRRMRSIAGGCIAVKTPDVQGCVQCGLSVRGDAVECPRCGVSLGVGVKTKTTSNDEEPQAQTGPKKSPMEILKEIAALESGETTESAKPKPIRITGDAKRLRAAHVRLTAWINYHYRQRDDQNHLRRAIELCEKQVAVGHHISLTLRRAGLQKLPTHRGFRLLAITAEREGRYKEAIWLCRTAKYQGWRGDWDKQIERCLQQLADQATKK